MLLCVGWLCQGQSWAQDANAQEGSVLRFSQQPSTKRSVPNQVLPTFMRGHKLQGVAERDATLTGDAELRRGGMVLRADEIHHQQVEDTLTATGNVHLLRDGNTYTGPTLRYDMDTDQGELGPGQFTLISTGGRADSKRTEFLGKDLLKLFDTRYSTCQRGDDSWYMQAGELDIDPVEGVGTARRAYVVFQGVPLLASPYLQFSINDQRRSGFLIPAFGVSSIRGIEIDAPYYWNIAPHRDYTLTPRIFSKRGVLLANEFRYLEPNYNGISRADIVPNDKETGGQRWAFESRHVHSLGRGWSGYWSVARASDDSYFDDYSKSVVTVSTRQLTQEGGLAYGAAWWSANARVQRFQVLQDAQKTISMPYERVPQITARAQRFNVAGFDMNTDFDFTQFSHPTLVTGARTVVSSQLSFPWQTPGFFLTPKLLLNLASYALEPDRITAGSALEKNFNRAIPTLSVDTGLNFERDLMWSQKPFLQTLEPRVFYVKTPYKNQAGAPLFDTGVPDLNFAQLFTENRFSGQDRVGDANQATVAVSSRLIERDSGQERVRASIGQRFYFSDQRVDLNNASVASTARKSDFLMALAGQITEAISVEATGQFSSTTQRASRSSIGIRYQRQNGEFASVNYRLVRDPTSEQRTLEQFDVTGQWRLSSRWAGVARVNYSTLDRKVTESLAGLEYRQDCWALRLVLQRFPTSTGASDVSAFVQLDLNGFTQVGSSPMPALQRNIPGYRPISEPSPVISPLQFLQ